MRNRIAVIACVLALGAGSLVTWGTMRGKASAPTAVASRSFARWPSDAAHSWVIPLPPDRRNAGDYITLQVREKASPLAPGVGPSISFTENPMKAAEADRVFGTGSAILEGATTPAEEATVSLQLLDLADIGAMSARPGQTLRLIGGMNIGGGMTTLGGDNIFLPSGSFGGWARNNSPVPWKNDEAFLMSFIVESGTQFFTYDVVLVRSKGQPASRATRLSVS